MRRNNFEHSWTNFEHVFFHLYAENVIGVKDEKLNKQVNFGFCLSYINTEDSIRLPHCLLTHKRVIII